MFWRPAGGEVDARADLFSVGVVLYRMTTGRLPYKGNDAVATLIAHRIVTRRLAAGRARELLAEVGLDPAVFAGHSLRAGFLTSAAKRGASIFKMMDVSRHRSVDTLRGYVRDAELFQDHAGAGLL